MRKSAVTQARVIRFVELYDLLSGVKVATSDIIQKIVERYAFLKFPKAFEELDIEKKGIEFFEGNSEFGPIQRFGIFNTGLVVDTRVDTDTSMLVLNDIVSWGKKVLQINTTSKNPSHAYISDVTFFSDVPLLRANPALSNLTTAVSKSLSEIWGESITYLPTAFAIGHDPLTRKNQIAQFRIERRSEHRFSENKYFSEAPLPTESHWELLEQYEKNIQG